MKKTFLYLISIIALFSSCKEKGTPCPNGMQLPPIPPVQAAKFRVLDEQTNRDLLSTSDTDRLIFDSLVAKQPCTDKAQLRKKLMDYSSGSNSGYTFSFEDIQQPTGENQDCYYLYLYWNGGDVDTIQFVTRIEYGECETYYFLDKVIFNNKNAELVNGYYALKK